VSGGKLACLHVVCFFCFVTCMLSEFNRRDFRAKFGRLINSKYVMMYDVFQTSKLARLKPNHPLRYNCNIIGIKEQGTHTCR